MVVLQAFPSYQRSDGCVVGLSEIENNCPKTLLVFMQLCQIDGRRYLRLFGINTDQNSRVNCGKNDAERKAIFAGSKSSGEIRVEIELPSFAK